MGKFLCLIYLLVANFNFAQNTKKDTIVEGKNYYFDVSLDMQTFNEGSDGKSRTTTKFINTKNDEVFAIYFYGSFAIYDYQKGLKHNYSARQKGDQYKLNYTGTEILQTKINKNNTIKINKIGDLQYEITRSENNVEKEKLIAQLQRTDEDLANSFFVNTELLNTKNWLNDLRKAEDNQPFAFSNYKVLMENEAWLDFKIIKIQKYDLAIKVPKK